MQFFCIYFMFTYSYKSSNNNAHGKNSLSDLAKISCLILIILYTKYIEYMDWHY